MTGETVSPISSTGGTTPLTPLVSSNGARVINNVSHILAAGPHVVAIVVVVCVTVLAADRVLVGNDVVTLFSVALGVPSAVAAAQSLRKSG